MSKSRFLLWRIVSVWVVNAAAGGLLVSSPWLEGGEPAARIVILQAEPNEWADALKLGFAAGLEAEGVEQGRDVVLILRYAAGNQKTLNDLAQRTAKERDLAAVYTLGTQASQAYFNAMRGDARKGSRGSVPMIFGAVTDPIRAGFYGKDGRSLNDLTGSVDVWPYEEQFALMRRLLPNAEKLGLVFDGSEANTQASLPSIQAAARGERFTLIKHTIDTAKQIGAAVDDVVAQKAEAIYIGPDNLTQANAATIVKVAGSHRIPVFAGDSGIVREGAAAAVGIDYFEVGKINGRQAARILDGERASTLAQAVAKEGHLYLNTEVLANLGILVRPELAFKTR